MDYRETLYRNYSDSLGRVSIDSVHHAVFSECYPELPAKKSSLIGDLGCGQGIWLRWLARLGYNNLVGIDVSLAELKLADQTPVIRWIHGQVTEVLQKKWRSGSIYCIASLTTALPDIFARVRRNEA